VFQGGDYFGRTVNVAARIADHAGSGQVLVTQEIVNATDRGDVAFTAIGPVALEGCLPAVELFSAKRQT
jgi:adenylate cyclase